MKYGKKTLVLGLLFLISTLNAQVEAPPFITDSLDIYIENAMKDWQIPGMAVAIIKDGKVQKLTTYGVKDLISKEAVDENTLFMIGSNTKAFTGILMASLAEQGVLSLDDPIKKWLPHFKLRDPWVAEHLTIADALSHRAGFETFQGDFMVFDSNLTPNQIIEKYSKLKPTHAFRTKWGYFNVGYMLAGEIVKVATGESWDKMVKDSIFTPLGMDNTLALSSDIATAKNRTKAHTYNRGKIVEIPYGDIDLVAPAGSISSSIKDMSIWVKTLLNNGALGTATVINPDAINTSISPFSIESEGGHPFNTSYFSLYGLGWGIVDYEEHRVIAHTGGIHGYVTSVTTVPEEGIGIVILTNTDANYFYEGLKWDILDAYLELPRNNYHKPYFEYFKGEKVREYAEIDSWKAKALSKPKTSVPLKNFVGTYTSEVYGWTKISKEGEVLTMTFQHHPDLSVNLSHIGDNQFMAAYNNLLYGVSLFPFTVDEDKVTGFTLKLAEFIERTTYNFKKTE